MKLSRSVVTLAPHATDHVTLTLMVPPSATAGQHYAGVIAVDAADLAALARARSAQHRTFQINSLTRVGMAVQINVPGSAKRSLALMGASIGTAPSGPTVQLSLSNSGNQLIPKTGVQLQV